MQKPMPLGEKQRTRFAIKWMLSAAEHRRGRTIEERLAREVLEVVKGKPEDNEVLRKKQDLHKLGMVNRCVIFRCSWMYSTRECIIFQRKCQSAAVKS